MTEGGGTDPAQRRNRRLTALGVAWVAVIVVLTLRPSSDIYTASGGCVFCGERGLADGILNLLLFAPLGVVAGQRGLKLLLIAGAGVALSVGIETIQFFLPGRDASIGDVLANGLGTLLGGALAPHLRTLAAPGADIARRISIAWAALLVLGVGMAAWLLEPRFGEGPLELETRPEAPEGDRFTGSVLGVTLDGEPVGDRDPVVWRSDGTLRLEVRFTLATVRWAFRPLVGFADARGVSWPVLLGPRETNLVLRLARPATRWGLTPPDLTLYDGLAGLPEGEPATAVVERDGDSVCLRVNGRESCGLGYTVGSGWALLLPSDWIDAGRARWLDALWLAALLFPLGYWHASGGRTLALLAGIVVVTLVLPSMTWLMAASAWTLPGIGAGWLLGLAAGGAARRALAER